MKVYEFGRKDKPVMMLLPGTCCSWTFFRKVIPGLAEHFRVACVSYDGFDPTENSEFPGMLPETRKIENYVRRRYGGRIFAAYGCSLGGSFVGLLISRRRIHMEHGILGSSDLDQAGKFAARVSVKLLTPIFYRVMKGGVKNNRLISFRLESERKKGDAYLERFLELMSPDDEVDFVHLKRKSMARQFYSDLVTPLPGKIDVPGTTVHVFYALKMGKKYRRRYEKYFKNPDIIEYDLRHEELLLYPDQWVPEVLRACGMKETE